MSVRSFHRLYTKRGRSFADFLSEPSTLAVALLVSIYCLCWILILTTLKYGQDIHFDSAEAYAWGLQFAWGYGKHPPLAGWIAGLWFLIFPTSNWAMYALSMVIIGIGIFGVWRIARCVLDPARSLFVVLLLMVYPIFNFKGFKFNPDQLQLAALPWLVLAFFRAFSKRTIASAVLLGLAGAIAVLTKYWAILMFGAIALAALAHRDRSLFFRSATPYVAVATFALAVAPHVAWLLRADFAPFHYASQYLTGQASRTITDSAGALAHHFGLLTPILLVFALAARPWRAASLKPGCANADELHVWVILAACALLPVVTLLMLRSRMRSDWEIPMFFLAPLALVLAGRMLIDAIAIRRAALCAAIYSSGLLLGSPFYAWFNFVERPDAAFFSPRSEAAQAVTAIWDAELGKRIHAVAGEVPLASAISFYSPDHPTMISESNPCVATWVDMDAARKREIIGICEDSNARCSAAVQELIPDARRIEVTASRTLFGREGRPHRWYVWLGAPTEPSSADERPDEEISAARKTRCGPRASASDR